MAGKTYKTRGIVLRKTKLAEKDLIVTILDETGSLVRAVAKGARKPGGSYAARLELFSIVDLMLAQGKNLDVITGATFTDEATRFPLDVEQAACASALAELLATIAQEDLPHERLYAMSKAAFEGIANHDSVPSLALTCSALLKALAYAGFRPSFASCIACGNSIDLAHAPSTVPFSVAEGGVTCDNCPRPSDALSVDASTIQWCEALMRSRFEEVLAYEPPITTLFDALHLIHQWTRVHANKNLKSLDFLLSSGLF